MTVRSLSPETTSHDEPSYVICVRRVSWPLRTKECALSLPCSIRSQEYSSMRIRGEGVHRVLGGVGRQHVGVGAGVVDLVHVAAQRDRDVEVLDVMGGAVPRDPDDSVLGLAVLVLSKKRGHVC
jgi:hypothetical protein